MLQKNSRLKDDGNTVRTNFSSKTNHTPKSPDIKEKVHMVQWRL